MKPPKEYKFRIPFTPATIPMDRLAQYMASLAEMLGENEHVHFARLEPGSTYIVSRIDEQAVPAVQEKTKAIKEGRGTVVQMEAYRNINRLLREDNGTGKLMEGDAEIIQFPGISEEVIAPSTAYNVKQQGELDGIIFDIGGRAEMAHLSIEQDGKPLTGFRAPKHIAKALGAMLYEPVRLFGTGTWVRTPEGEWKMEKFIVENYEKLVATALSKTVMELRGLTGDKWGEDPIKDLMDMRKDGDE